MHLGILIFSLCQGKGGAERAAINLAEGLIQRGNKCTLFYSANDNEIPAYFVPDKVECINVSKFEISEKWFSYARKIIKKSNIDVICMFNSNYFGNYYISLCNGLHVPIIYAEHTSPNAAIKDWDICERIACMAASDAIIFLCEGYIHSVPYFLQNRISVIPNFSSLMLNQKYEKKYKEYRKSNNKFILLSVARLFEQAKQLSLLIRAFSQLSNDFPDWECRICGEGKDRQYYESLINELKLEGRVNLVGNIEDVSCEYKNADLFAFPSRYEGFPLALLEAQCFGLPAIGFAECPGVNEIIINKKTGLLVPKMTTSCFANYLRKLMQNEELRINIGEQARILSERYNKDDILEKWEKICHSVIHISQIYALDKLDDIKDILIRNTLYRIMTSPRSFAELMCSKLRKRIQYSCKQYIDK